MIRAYVATQIGTGRSREDAIRSKVRGYIDITAGERYWEFDNPARIYSFVIVSALFTTHVAIADDPDIQVLSELYNDRAELTAGIQKTVSEYPTEIIQTMQPRLELLGINTGWITGTTPIKQIYSYIIKVFTLSQWALGHADSELLDFLRENLTTQVTAVPQNIRDRVLSWMLANGLATGWIQSTTTVREVLHYIIMNLPFQLIEVAGEWF